MGWDNVGMGQIPQNPMGWDGMGWEIPAMGWDGMGYIFMGWDGTGTEKIKFHGMGWDASHPIYIPDSDE